MGYWDTIFGPNSDQQSAELDVKRKQLEYQNLLAQQTAQSKLGIGVDPTTGIAWNPPTAPSGNYTDAASGQSQPIGNASPDVQNLLRPGMQQQQTDNQNLLRQAFPKEAEAAMTARMAPPQFMPLKEGEAPGVYNPATGSWSPSVDAQGNPVGTNEKPTDAMRDAIAAGLKPGTLPWSAYMQKVMNKATYIPEQDPVNVGLKQAETNKDIAEGAKANAMTKALDNSSLTPQSIDMYAQQILTGDNSPLQNLGRGTQGASNLAALRNRVTEMAQEQGLTGAQLAGINAQFGATKQAMGVAAKRGANLDMATAEVGALSDEALNRSAQVDRIGWVPFDKLGQLASNADSNPEYGKFLVANQGLMTAYSQVMARAGTPTDSARAHAEAILNTATDQKGYAARVAQLRREAQIAQGAPGQVRADLLATITGRNAQAPTAPPQGIPPAIPPGTPFATGPNGQVVHFINGKWQ